MNTSARPTRERVAKPQRTIFLRKFLQGSVRVASITPSSRSLSTAMTEHVDPAKTQTIVELGAGTGAITAAVARCMHPGSRLYALEVDPDLCAQLRARVPEAVVIQGDVRELPTLLQRLDAPPADLLLSALPSAGLAPELNRVAFEYYESLPPGTWFSQATIIPWVARGLFRRLFETSRFQFVPTNLPPGGAYHCRGLRPGWREALPG